MTGDASSHAGDGVDESITLHSSWRGIVFSMFGALVVLAVGVGVTIGTRGAPVAVAVLLIGVLFTTTVLFDYPVASTFHRDLVERRAPLRRHRIRWDRVDQLTRARPGVSGGFRTLTPGGLTAKVGRRRYLLVDQCESLSEFDQLQALLDGRIEALAIDELIVPPDDVDPTWTYRRRRWARRVG